VRSAEVQCLQMEVQTSRGHERRGANGKQVHTHKPTGLSVPAAAAWNGDPPLQPRHGSRGATHGAAGGIENEHPNGPRDTSSSQAWAAQMFDKFSPFSAPTSGVVPRGRSAGRKETGAQEGAAEGAGRGGRGDGNWVEGALAFLR
jgi:hypothetical protein